MAIMLKVDQDRAFGRIKWNFIKFVCATLVSSLLICELVATCIEQPGFVCDHQWPIFWNVPKF